MIYNNTRVIMTLYNAYYKTTHITIASCSSHDIALVLYVYDEEATCYPQPRFQVVGRRPFSLNCCVLFYESAEADHQDNTSRHTVAQPVGAEPILDAA